MAGLATRHNVQYSTATLSKFRLFVAIFPRGTILGKSPVNAGAIFSRGWSANPELSPRRTCRNMRSYRGSRHSSCHACGERGIPAMPLRVVRNPDEHRASAG